ncbi:hypothetical protein N7533_011001 [Penicillium manginii]|uniref:uncharacterized protein n=1 Tax=Penicillium manginii TaxID=203109 RepID=UPI002548DE71|nr:uncharacterized protein N7533_011001 [Penicillium manginii]KAJ5741592.1 hypothetical protein N7533_011001 [Penicillium manginii]
MGGPDPHKKARIQFKNLSNTLKSKAHKLSEKCGARVYLFIEHERECFVYKSLDDLLWPPPDGLLEKYYNGLDRKGFKDMQTSASQDEPDHVSQEWLSARREHLCGLEKLYRLHWNTKVQQDAKEETNVLEQNS